MSSATLVSDPERISTQWQLDQYLERIRLYQREYHCKAGVLFMQNRQLGAMFFIESEQDAKQKFEAYRQGRIVEIPLKFYTLDDLVSMRDRLPP